MTWWKESEVFPPGSPERIHTADDPGIAEIYGSKRMTIDFSVTPLNLGNSWTIQIPTDIPQGKVIHKMVIVGFGINDPDGDSFSFGLDSDLEYFTAGPGILNDDPGSVSSGNSKRTLVTHEDFNVRWLGTGSINTGRVEIVIFYT